MEVCMRKRKGTVRFGTGILHKPESRSANIWASVDWGRAWQRRLVIICQGFLVF